MSVQRFGVILGLCFFLCAAACSRAQLPTFGSLGSSSPLVTASAHHTHATLELSADTAKPGDTIWAGIDMKMDPDWHTYWKNSGEAGMPTKITWQLPPGITAGDIQWPLPKKLPPAEVTTYGYDNEVMLLVPLTIASNLPPGQLDLKANVSWLECKDVCIPANQDVEATLTIGVETKTSANAGEIESWKQKVPQVQGGWVVDAGWEKPADGDTRQLDINGLLGIVFAASATPPTNFDFFPDANDNYDIQPATETLQDTGGTFKLRKAVKKYSGDWPKAISGVVTYNYIGDNSRRGFTVDVPVGDSPPTMGITSTTGTSMGTSESESSSLDGVSPHQNAGGMSALPLMLLYAFLGGLILNIMPCVLPVIALKILGFVSEARSEPQRVRNLGFIYGLGVLASFLVLAGIVIGVEAAGHHAGWGMQFGNPVFVVCLTILVTLVALNLFGVFEVTPGGAVMDAAGKLAGRHGAPGAFFNGVLATALATPCTAPFLAASLGFVFSQNNPTIIVLIFTFIGLGLAAPYVLLSCNPALLKFLPKPGAWMEKFKIAMGFPMLATVVWLFNIASDDYGARVFWLGVFLVVLSLAAWIFGEFIQRGRGGKGLALALVLLLLGGGYAYALESQLHWRDMTVNTSASAPESSGGVDWQAWSPDAVAQARAAGKPVLVDFTARWCVTCNAIIKPAIENSAIAAKLKALGAVTLLADYTRTPQAMTDEIAREGGAGVPLVLIYPKDAALPPFVLPQPSPLQLPSSYGKIVSDTLDRAAN